MKNARSNKEKNKIKPVVVHGSSKLLNEDEKDYIRSEYVKNGFKVLFKNIKTNDQQEIIYSTGNQDSLKKTNITLKIKRG